MGSVSTNDFNYASVDEETAQKLEYYAKTGHALIRKSQIQFIADMGKLLCEARAVMAKHGDGKFTKWAVAEFDTSRTTIFNYITAWENVLCHGLENYLHWSPTAVYFVAGEECSVSVRKKLENIPATGTVRVSDVKRLIAPAKPKPSPSATKAEKPPAAADAEPVGVPFGEDPEPPPQNARQKREEERRRKAAAKAKERAEKAKAKEEERAAKAKAKAAEREAKAKAKEQAKADRAAAREKEKEDAFNDLPLDEQIRLTKQLIEQLVYRAVNTTDAFNRLKRSPNLTRGDANAILKVVEGLHGKTIHIAVVKLLQHTLDMLW